MKEVFLGIGTNLGNRVENLKETVEKIEEHIGHIIRYSSVYETEPWGFQTQDQFLNMVVMVETKLSPSGLLGSILMIEALLGRVRDGGQYASRLIDIDILMYDNLVLEEKTLKIPHPKMHLRKFVLVPLCEIGQGLNHPVLNRSIASLLKKCTDKSKVSLHSNPLSAKL
jgi:2-amino-4-hydroxy-6-hydroxymethyldihydropteridine diphosphokinase